VLSLAPPPPATRAKNVFQKTLTTLLKEKERKLVVQS
jgi:hypothetical protein